MNVMSFQVHNWKKIASAQSENLLDPSLNTLRSGQNEDTRLTRRKHKKSRKGCLTCKRRHVRCDENVPRCLNCTRRNQSCTYEINEYDDSGRLIPLGDEYPNNITATTIGQSETKTWSSNLSRKTPTPESISNDLKAASERKLSTQSLDPYAASPVRLTPSMREHLNYCEG